MDDRASLEIVTARLRLRPWQRADLAAYAAWPPFSEPWLAVFNSAPRTATELDLAWTAAQFAHKAQHWTILEGSTVIGRLSLRDIRRVSGDGRLGMQLGAPYVGQGRGTEALQGWLAAYFTRWHFTRVDLEVAGWNERATRLYRRCGFRARHAFWQAAGPAAAWAWLDEPAAAPFAPYFRRSPTDVYSQWLEMELDQRSWYNAVHEQLT